MTGPMCEHPLEALTRPFKHLAAASLNVNLHSLASETSDSAGLQRWACRGQSCMNTGKKCQQHPKRDLGKETATH